MLFTPKPLQIEAYNKLGASAGKGNKRIVLQASTGVGKTFLAAMITEKALAKGKRVTFVAPYTTLINQTVSRFTEQELPQPGVMQGQHELTDANCSIQIATAQTLGRRDRPIADIVFVDECHLMYKAVLEWMEAEPGIIFIGLSATPWAKGMGKYWQDLIKIKSLRECIEDGTLSDYEVMGVECPDLSSIPLSKGDYKEKELGDFMSGAKLVGNIVQNWLENGKNGQTIAFAVNVLHANEIANKFSNAGVPVEVITARTKNRDEIFTRYEQRQTRIIVSVGCLIAGFDSYVDCIIWASAYKSAIKFVQGIGRGLRNHPDKKICYIFDHAGTFTKLGYPEDVDELYEELCSGEKQEVEIKKIEREVKAEKLPKLCPSPGCGHKKPAGIHECPKCGFSPRFGIDSDVDESRGLKKLKKEKPVSKEDKQIFWSELKGWQKQELILKDKVRKDGQIGNIYRDKHKVWPRGLTDQIRTPSPETLNFIKSRQIAYAKSRGNK